MKLTHLLVNHITKPFIDSAPEFSWRIESDSNDVIQESYRITVVSGEKIFWDSGVVADRKQSFIPYEGLSLAEKTEYIWSVTVTDNHGDTAEESSAFETAIQFGEKWRAKWIGSSIPRNESKLFTYGIENHAVIFERGFSLDKPLRKARLYATCYGAYRAFINGKRIDDRELAPEFTPYEKILYYQCYDVTELLAKGENVLSFLVGDGWYFCPQTSVVTEKPVPAPAVLYQLEAEYSDGQKEYICSDGSEKCGKSSILFSDLFAGERQDLTAREEIILPVTTNDYGYDQLRVQALPPIMVVETFTPEKVYVSPAGETIVDFGQVIAGKCEIVINEPADTEITLEHSEVVDKDGNYFTALSARQCDSVICDGKEHRWVPAFTFHGFRYVRVTGMISPTPDRFKALLLSTEKEDRGDFTCDDKRFDRLYKNIRYSQRNNMISIPTDCPSREKAGWTGDILIYAKAAIQNEEMTPFLTSWIEGLIADCQNDGVVPLVSPLTNLYKQVASIKMSEYGDNKLAGIAGWSDTIVWVPYDMYRTTGNRLILQKAYPAMKSWVDYIITTAAEKRGSDFPEDIDRYLWNTGFHFGEWLVPRRPGDGLEICKETACYIAPMFGYQCLKLFCEIREILGKTDDRKEYPEIADRFKYSVQTLMRNGELPDHLQGLYVLANAFDLVPEDLQDAYSKRLAALVETNGNCLGTGFLGTPFILNALEKIGRKDLAKAVLRQTRMPSWLYEVEHGATTIWERWDAVAEDGTPDKTSFDHYAFGVVDDFLLRRVCGITMDSPECESVTISPDLYYGFDNLTREYVTEKGLVRVHYSGDKLEVEIPCNMTATVIWNGEKYTVGSGQYSF